MRKPKFYQTVLTEIKDNVFDHVYPYLNEKEQMTMTERMGNETANCPDCTKNEWILLAMESVSVRQGGKPYIECIECGYLTHL